MDTAQSLSDLNLEIIPGPHGPKYRVRLCEDQAVVAFPKHNTYGIGFEREDADVNRNLPATIVDELTLLIHIGDNAGPIVGEMNSEIVLAAIRMLQSAVRAHLKQNAA